MRKSMGDYMRDVRAAVAARDYDLAAMAIRAYGCKAMGDVRGCGGVMTPRQRTDALEQYEHQAQDIERELELGDRYKLACQNLRAWGYGEVE